MQSFEAYIMKYGEHGVQALLEMWENGNRIAHQHSISLEERWDFFIRSTDHACGLAA